MKNSTTLSKLRWTAFFMWAFLFAMVFALKALPQISTESGIHMFAFTAYADGEGSDGSGGGSDGGGGDSSAGSNGATDSSDANGGGCGDCGGSSTDTSGGAPSGGISDFGGSESVAYVAPVQMSGSISSNAGACVPSGSTWKRRVNVWWNAQNTQYTIVQGVGGQYGNGQNISPQSSNSSGSMTLELPAGAYIFGLAGYHSSSNWAVLNTVTQFVNTDDCAPKPVVHWTPYCTMGNDPNGNNWQWWEYSDTNPVQYRYLRAGDGVCVPPPTQNPVCPAGTTGTYPNCVTPTVHWTPYCTMGNDPKGNNWQWWEYSDTNPVQYRYLRAGDGVCVPPVTPVHWTPYCTMGNDPKGNNWQWWEYSDTNPVQYRYLRAGDGVCVPPPTQNPVCPAGTTGTYPACVVVNNNNNNTNNNTNNNNNVITINNPTPQTQIIYRDRDRSRNYDNYRYNDYDACTVTVSPNTVAYGQAVTLSWSSNSNNAGWIEGVGNVGPYGSMQTTPTRSGVYTGRFVGHNGQTVTCSAYVTVSGYTQNTPYVSLAAVPYTGLELGPYGTVIYWSFLILWCLFAAYLVAVKKIQNNIVRWFVGTKAVQPHEHAVAHPVHAPAAHQETHAHMHQQEAVDPFIAQQLKLVQK